VAIKIGNVLHKGLRRFIEDDDASGLQSAVVPKLRRMISFLQDMAREDELRSIPSWKAHQLTGDRKGEWSLSVTKNWRLTFRIDQAEIEIINLDYEDYH
jgi:proteic killer suppression protein